MNLTTLSFILLFFSIYSIWKRLVAFVNKEQGQSLFKLIATIFVWGGISYTAFFPGQIRVISKQFGFGDNLNTLIFFGFILIFVIIFRIIAVIEKNERIITEIVRKEALKDLK